MKKVLLGLVIILMISGNVKAQMEFYLNKNGIIGLGNLSCVIVTQEGHSTQQIRQIRTYISGLITGLNIANQTFKGNDVALMLNEVIQRCEEDPYSGMYSVTLMMYQTLPTIPQQP